MKKNNLEQYGWGRIFIFWSFVRGSPRGSGLLRNSQIVVRSEEIRSNVGKLTYAGKNAHQKSANSNETAGRTPDGGLGQHRTM